tara:strand:+ start:621 stop:1013 length:393 start_codon:yes stop_codon:yes gene_type:complete
MANEPWKPFNFFGASNVGPKPRIGDYTYWNDNDQRAMTVLQQEEYRAAMNNWNIKNQEREKRRKIFQDMAQTPGPTPNPFKSKAGTREAGDPLTPVQVAGGFAPSDPMARYGRPKKWPYLQSIVNMGKLT